MQVKEETIGDVIVLLDGGVPAEYRYLERRFGRRGTDGDLVRQLLVTRDGRSFDELWINTKAGIQKILFDISAILPTSA